jgi:hypothetical protein
LPTNGFKVIPLGHMKSAHWVNLESAPTHRALKDPVQWQNRLLLDVLNLHKAHVGPDNGFANRLRGGVLVGFDIGLDALGPHQFAGVPKAPLSTRRTLYVGEQKFCLTILSSASNSHSWYT